MDRPKMQSPDLHQVNLEQLREVFPGVVTEVADQATGKIRLGWDSDKARLQFGAEIGNTEVAEGKPEPYGLGWPGRRKAHGSAFAPLRKSLRPVQSESSHFDSTRNLFFEGDNLEVLKLLQDTYQSKVKMIYIDPPYNSGSDLIYRDNFVSDQLTQEFVAGERETDNARLVANPERNGRFHSNWLTMMDSRLRLARNLLTPDGAIFVSCDEMEQPRLRLIMDEIFGGSNLIADIVWETGQKNNSKLVSVSHEYIVCYARNLNFMREKGVKWRQQKKGIQEIYAEYRRLRGEHSDDHVAMAKGLKKWYKSLPVNDPAKSHKHYSHIDERGVYFPGDISAPGGGGPKFEVFHPVSKRPVKKPSNGWRIGDPARMKKLIDDGRIHFGMTEETVPCIKRYLSETEWQVQNSVIYTDARAALQRLRELMGITAFDYPKDEYVIQKLVEIATEGDDIVLDFFAGSGTTAHAVMRQNAVDGGNRRFVMIQLAEAVKQNAPAANAGYRTIAEISRERIKRAGKHVLSGDVHPNWRLDVGFRMFRVDTSNMLDSYYEIDQIDSQHLFDTVDNIRSDRSADDLLFQVIGDSGLDFSLPISRQHIDGKTVFQVGGGGGKS